MRMRKKAWARPELEACPYFIKNPQELKGNWSNWFPKKQPLHLELGCGKGVFLSELAVKHPDINYIGIDLSPDVLGVARRNIQTRYEQENRKVENIALVAYDIERILQIMNANDEIDRVYINFCNPWPKMRHHKKRLTHTNQLQTYKTFIKDGAQIHFKTDDGGLYQSTLRYLGESGFEILWYTTNLYENGQPPADNITTEHEQRFTAQGIKIKAIKAGYHKENEKQNNGQNLFQQKESVVEKTMDKK